MANQEIPGVVALLDDLSDAELEAFTPAEIMVLAAELGLQSYLSPVRLALLESRVSALEAAGRP
jgi:sulfur transfer protein SufE